MKIGLDFDNTIVCYDEAFYINARERGVIPAEVGRSKVAVKDFLQANDLEEDWIALQGHVYGPGIAAARPFAGVIEFIGAAGDAGHSVYIVSHKTRHPFRGPQHDLHQHAAEWLMSQGIVGGLLERSAVYFELTKEAKLQRVGNLGCDSFVDDLPSILEHPEFPKHTRPVLFDPTGSLPMDGGWTRLKDWSDAAYLLEPDGNRR